MRESHLLIIFLTVFLMVLVKGASSSDGTGPYNTNGDSLTGTNWTLIALDGDEISPGPALTLRFEADGSLGGFDGCNRYHGSSIIEGTTLRISDQMATTRAACSEPLMKRANAYTKVLLHTASFSINRTRLSLRDTAGHDTAIFEVGNQTLDGTSWKIIAYNNGNQAVVSVLSGTHISARFGDDGGVTGSAGCNRYFAEYLGDKGSIIIGLPGATRRFCAEPEGTMDQEARYLKALQSATSFLLEGERLTLRTSSGALAVTLLRDSAAEPTPTASAKSKIRFDLDRLNKDGLQGPPGGLRALDYEYCIPNQAEAIAAVRAIDPTLRIQRGSPGRVGCSGNELLLCLGNTHQRNYRAILEQLSELPFVSEIREAFFE